VRHSEIFSAVIEQALTEGTLVRFRAEGISMYPTIRDGEAITVAPVAADEVVTGDVLLCRQGTRVLAHRVVDVTRCGTERIFELRGDAKISCDAPVRASAVVGRVVGVVRNGRVISLSGRVARLRYHARKTASRSRSFIAAGLRGLSNCGYHHVTVRDRRDAGPHAGRDASR
jgi:signal peptidase I